jgi:hypothetical protein
MHTNGWIICIAEPGLLFFLLAKDQKGYDKIFHPIVMAYKPDPLPFVVIQFGIHPSWQSTEEKSPGEEVSFGKANRKKLAIAASIISGSLYLKLSGD